MHGVHHSPHNEGKEKPHDKVCLPVRYNQIEDRGIAPAPYPHVVEDVHDKVVEDAVGQHYDDDRDDPDEQDIGW